MTESVGSNVIHSIAAAPMAMPMAPRFAAPLRGASAAPLSMYAHARTCVRRFCFQYNWQLRLYAMSKMSYVLKLTTL